MSNESKPRPQKRSEDFTDHYARLQTLLMSGGAARRDIDGRPKLDHTHPDVQRCADWMEKASTLNTPPESQYSSLSKKDRIDRWQTLKRNLSPAAMGRLTRKVEQHYGVQPYSNTDTSALEPGAELSDQADLQDEIDFHKEY